MAAPARWRRVHPRQKPGEIASSAIDAPITRNQATVCGSTSSNSDTAIAAPMYCEIAERRNSASGGAVESVRSIRPEWAAVTAVSVEQLWIGAADLLPERLEREPARQWGSQRSLPGARGAR